MNIIPVIDLLNGVVVYAKQGQRQHYQPIQSQLTHSSKPLDIVSALLDVYPFETLYIADLNAIQKFQPPFQDNYVVIEKIMQHYPHLKLWIDAGVTTQLALNHWQTLHASLILGSENFAALESYTSLINEHKAAFILSLDFMSGDFKGAGGFKGAEAILSNAHYWPENIIVMALSNVGANQGPNIPLLQNIANRGKGKNLYAAGGVRNTDDLMKLKAMHIKGALMATAIHQQQISNSQLAEIIS
jgi:phosphoribosylformimino-5-aminoimidazole carboxamide ribotide isomerase